MASETTAEHTTEQEHHPTGWRRYVYSTNHKDIGTMYLISQLFRGLLAVRCRC